MTRPTAPAPGAEMAVRRLYYCDDLDMFRDYIPDETT